MTRWHRRASSRKSTRMKGNNAQKISKFQNAATCSVFSVHSFIHSPWPWRLRNANAVHWIACVCDLRMYHFALVMCWGAGIDVKWKLTHANDSTRCFRETTLCVMPIYSTRCAFRKCKYAAATHFIADLCSFFPSPKMWRRHLMCTEHMSTCMFRKIRFSHRKIGRKQKVK